jgi:hypothetical protein
MLSLGLVRVINNHYTYSEEFENAVLSIKQHPPGKFQQTKLAYRLNREILPVLLSYGVTLMKKGEDQSNIKIFSNLCAAYIALDIYFNKTKIAHDSKDMPNFVYAIYYLNLRAVPVESDVE